MFNGVFLFFHRILKSVYAKTFLLYLNSFRNKLDKETFNLPSYFMEYMTPTMEYQRMMLKMNMERLRERAMTNQLLSSIVKDYEAYEKKLNDQYYQHENQMNYIAAYINDLMESNGLTESGLNQAKYEQVRILEKLEELKKAI
jgi:hypothetical protein